MKTAAHRIGLRQAAVSALLSVVAAASALTPALVYACGACDEDKVAATYDHDVVGRAKAVGDSVVYYEVSGAFDAGRLANAVRHIRGVRRDSVRVSAAPAALSFAFDPKLQSAAAAVDAAQRALPAGSRLRVVRLLPA